MPQLATKTSSSIRAAIYARISMDRTGAGLGVQRQREDCERLVLERGWTLVASFADNDVSAYSGKPRPGYRQLLEGIRAGHVDVVVAWHTDRLHRNPTELEEYIQISEAAHVGTVTVRAGDLDLSSAAGRMVARMLGAAARHESEQKSERVSRRRRQDAEAGRAHGPLGYGYDSDQNIIPEEAAIIRELAARLIEGESLYSLAVDLNERCVPTPGAGRWTHRQVESVVNPGRLGEPDQVDRRVPAAIRDLVVAAVEAGRVPENEIESILAQVGLDTSVEAQRASGTLDRWMLLEMLRSEEPTPYGRVATALTAARVSPPRTHWRAANLRAMLRRGSLCGWRDFGPGRRGGGEMVAQGSWEPILTKDESLKIRAILDAPERKRVGRERRYLLSSILVCGRCGAPLGGSTSARSGRRYECSSQPGLSRCGGLTIVAEPVEQAVVAAVLAALSVGGAARRRRPADTDESVAQAEAELASVRGLRSQYARDAAEGRITREEWLTVRESLNTRQLRAERTIGLHASSPSLTLAAIPSQPAELERWWNEAPLARQRAVLSTLIERVVVRPGQRGGNRFDLGRVESPVWRF